MRGGAFVCMRMQTCLNLCTDAMLRAYVCICTYVHVCG